MDKKRLKEIKEMSDNARKSMAGELESIKKQQENLMKLKLVIEAVGELLKDNPDFRKQFDFFVGLFGGVRFITYLCSDVREDD